MYQSWRTVGQRGSRGEHGEKRNIYQHWGHAEYEIQFFNLMYCKQLFSFENGAFREKTPTNLKGIFQFLSIKGNIKFSLDDSLSHNVFCHFWDLAPFFFWKFKTSRHDLFPHVLWNCPTLMLRVKRRVSAQHHINDDTQRPQITVLKAKKPSFLEQKRQHALV